MLTCIGAWILSGGNNAGVMKLVGKAVHEFAAFRSEPVVLIGVAPWGCVANRQLLCTHHVVSAFSAFKCEYFVHELGLSRMSLVLEHILVQVSKLDNSTSELVYEHCVRKQRSRCSTGGRCKRRRRRSRSPTKSHLRLIWRTWARIGRRVRSSTRTIRTSSSWTTALPTCTAPRSNYARASRAPLPRSASSQMVHYYCNALEWVN